MLLQHSLILFLDLIFCKTWFDRFIMCDFRNSLVFVQLLNCIMFVKSTVSNCMLTALGFVQQHRPLNCVIFAAGNVGVCRQSSRDIR